MWATNSPCCTRAASSRRVPQQTWIGASIRWFERSCDRKEPGSDGRRRDRAVNRAKAVGAGVFVVMGIVLFTAALFMIGERRMLFERRFPVYAEFGRLGQLETGAIVRVSGLDAGEVTAIEIPASPEGKFRVRMEVRETLHQLVRMDSIATTQTEGLVGGVFLNISGGTDASPRVPEDGTILSREPFQIADLLQQAS